MNRPPLEVADIIRSAGESFLEQSRHWITRQHRKVLLAILQCRTAGHLGTIASVSFPAANANVLCISLEVNMRIKRGGKLVPFILMVTALVALAGSLWAQDVTYNSMPGTDFTEFHTYKWVIIQGASYPNQILDTEIKDAINSQLQAKGLTLTDSDKADLYVGYQT
jgi:hypothetical protein